MIDIKNVTPDTVRYKKSAKLNRSPPSMVSAVTAYTRNKVKPTHYTRTSDFFFVYYLLIGRF